MNRDFTKRELAIIKNLFSEQEFASLINRIQVIDAYDKFETDIKSFYSYIQTVDGVTNIDMGSEGYSDYDFIVYDYRERKNVRINFASPEFIKLRTKDYNFKAKSVEALREVLATIHKAIDDGII